MACGRLSPRSKSRSSPSISPPPLARGRDLHAGLALLSALHRIEEIAVRLRVLHLVDEEFDRGQLVHRMQELAQDPDLLQLVLARDQFLTTRAGAIDVHCWEHT